MNQTFLGRLEDHNSSVRSLNYTPLFGGFILSVGAESYINIWSPGTSLSESHAGKLFGHTSPVVSAKFIHTSPFIVSIDVKINIRIWDVKSQNCIQIISTDSKTSLPCFGLLTFPNAKQFAVLSKRLIFYDTNEEMEEVEDINDFECIFAAFNEHYLNFIVVTKKDIRIYNASDGRVNKIFRDVLGQKSQCELTAATLDTRQRKIYVGDS